MTFDFFSSYLVTHTVTQSHTHIVQHFHIFCLLFTVAVADDVARIRHEQSNFTRWVDAFRTHSHRMARTNPIEIHTIERFV